MQDEVRSLARFHLDLAHALFARRERLRMSLEELAHLSGLAPERIEMIEEGDTTSLTEVAQICAALRVSFTLFEGYQFRLNQATEVRWIQGPPQEPPATIASKAEITATPERRQYFEAPRTLAGVS